MQDRINICQPGFNASCAFCCGSHNIALTINEINNIFKKRKKISDIEEITKKYYPALFEDGMQCPNIVMIDPQKKIIGCKAYNKSNLMNKKNLDFFQNVCKKFQCRAMDVLTNKEILFAAKLTGDWFYYSLLINEIAVLQNITKRYKNPEEIPVEQFNKIKIKLEKLITP